MCELERDRLWAYHSRDFIGYIVLKIYRHDSRFKDHARMNTIPRVCTSAGIKISLVKVESPVTGMIIYLH